LKMPSQFIPQKLFGIIGYPLGHSLSPILHNWAFQQHNLPFVYFSWPLPPDSLAEFMVSMHTLPIHGCSLTMPFKQKVISYIDSLTPQALSTKSINTLYWKDNLLWGENTDCQGFMDSLTTRSIAPESALILGAGGASRACLYGLKQLGSQQIFVTSRHQGTLNNLEHNSQIPFQKVDWQDRTSLQANLLINATPLGMSGELIQRSPFPSTELHRFEYVYDLIYNPTQTILLHEANKAGCLTINGLDMFILQAKSQSYLWTGICFSEKGAKEHLLSEL